MPFTERHQLPVDHQNRLCEKYSTCAYVRNTQHAQYLALHVLLRTEITTEKAHLNLAGDVLLTAQVQHLLRLLDAAD